jgi:hypothetical protein
MDGEDAAEPTPITGTIESRDGLPGGAENGKILPGAVLELPYVPDFLLDDVRFWFAPGREAPTAVYHELVGRSAESWGSYCTKKGWAFLDRDPRPGEGPYRVRAGCLRLHITEPGRFFIPRPTFRFDAEGTALPVVSLEKRRPLNPWKPNYIQALNFIKKYEWLHPLPAAARYAIWEVEECGQVAGSTSWRNAEAILRDSDSPELRNTLADIFTHRPEDYPLGSEVYLRVLGSLGPDSFAELCRLAEHPISRKRRLVAITLGRLGQRAGLDTLLALLDDEDPEVRRQALRSIGKVGVEAGSEAAGKIAPYLGEGHDLSQRVWAAAALVKGGDDSHEKFLITLVKEEPRLLTDMGELGDVLADLGLEDTVPFLINRLKSEKPEFRADAAEALEKVTGIALDYQSMDTDEQRRNAIKTCSRWWEDRKKRRRVERRAP